jgi:putative nucleotidyltransferase with HDIG domain
LPQIETHVATSINQSIAALTAAQGSRDPFTVQHQERVSSLAVAIGTQLGLAEERLEILRLAAVVHDIGKMAVPAEILGKPGALSGPEYALIKTHCVIGFGILQELQSPLPIAEIAYQHHERLDGSGYPRGLSGNRILLEARIVSVADVYDAMTSNRAYRAGMPADFVLETLRGMAGSLLDADAVEACQHCILSAPALKGFVHQPEARPAPSSMRRISA